MTSMFRELFCGLLVLSLFMAAPWLADEVARANRIEPESKVPVVASREPYYDMAVSRHDEQIATVGYHGQVTISRMDDPAAEINLLVPQTRVTSLQFSQYDSALLLGCQDGSVLWQSLDPFNEPRLLASFEEPVTAVAVSPDGCWTAMATYPDEEDVVTVAIVDPETGVVRCQISTERLVTWLGFTPNGRELICRDTRGAIFSFSSSSGVPRKDLTFSKFGAGPVTIGSTGKWVALGGTQGQVALIDWHKQQVVRQWSTGTVPVTALRLTPDGTQLACGTEDQLLLFNRIDQSIVSKSPTRVHRANFNAEGTKLITSGHDGIIRRWSIPDLVEEQHIVSDPL